MNRAMQTIRSARWLMLGAALLAGSAWDAAEGQIVAQTEVQAQTQSQSGSSGQQVAAPNPYIQSAPVTGMGQMPNGVQGIPGTANGAIEDPSQRSLTGVFYPDIKEYVLSPGELINLRMFGAPEFSSTLRLSKDGTGELPLIGSMPLGGLTIERAERLVEEKLVSAGMYRHPVITITLGEESRDQSKIPSVTLAGELHASVPLRGRTSLRDVIYSAGGLPTGTSHVVSIIRPGVEAPILVDLGTTAEDLQKVDFQLQPKDTIFVQRSGVIYVLGDFKTTGMVPMQPGRTTLMQVAALSGGPTYAGAFADMRIIRTTGTQRSEVKVDIKKVLYGKIPDPIMQAGDIVFLPPSTLKTVLTGAGIGVLLNVVNLALLITR